MKLKTKLTALCGALLVLVAFGLTGAMLWQVREQSYASAQSKAEEIVKELSNSFEMAVVHGEKTNASSQKPYWTYCFRSLGVPGSALLVNGEIYSAGTTIPPEKYLDTSGSWEIRSARRRVDGKFYLVSGKALELRERQCQVFLVTDVTYIQNQLLRLAGTFALLALTIGLMGLLALRWLIGRTLRPLADLSQAADGMAKGSYSQRVPVAAQDEVGLLAENFNEMAQAVETHVDELQEQNRRQKLFLGAVAHELKTPLTSLLLNVNTLQTVYLPQEKQEELLESMDTQLHWLETMVKKLLTLLSMNRNAKFTQTSVPELLDQVEKLTKDTCEKYGVYLETAYRTRSCTVDKDLMCSALVNLVENSAKASKPGSTIRLLAEEEGFTVMDQGCGIAQEDLERVTEPFYMGDPSRSKAKGGFGLGLALVKEIAAVHGGKLELESKPGAGTVARIMLKNGKDVQQ